MQLMCQKNSVGDRMKLYGTLALTDMNPEIQPYTLVVLKLFQIIQELEIDINKQRKYVPYFLLQYYPLWHPRYNCPMSYY